MATYVKTGRTQRADSKPFSKFAPSLPTGCSGACFLGGGSLGSTLSAPPASNENPEEGRDRRSGASGADCGERRASGDAASEAPNPSSQEANLNFPCRAGSAQLAERNLLPLGEKGLSATRRQQPPSPHAFLDLEGRVVVTEHSQFVLFNVYVPNNGRACERLAYKMHFLHGLRAAMWRERCVCFLFSTHPQKLRRQVNRGSD